MKQTNLEYCFEFGTLTVTQRQTVYHIPLINLASKAPEQIEIVRSWILGLIQRHSK